MGGHTKVDDLPSSVADHKPGVQQSELDGRDHKKVHRGDTMPVIAKKRLPSLALIAVGTSFREISRDRGEADGNPKLSQFRLDLPRSPAVLIRKSPNEGLQLG